MKMVVDRVLEAGLPLRDGLHRSCCAGGLTWALRLLVAVAVPGVMLLPVARAVPPRGQLPKGQALVDSATSIIDTEVSNIVRAGLALRPTYEGMVEAIDQVRQFLLERVAPRYPLDTPEGLLIADGIGDTLAVRLSKVAAEYVKGNPDEMLGPGRIALETVVTNVSLPPGRFLGFHFHTMVQIYATQAESLLAAIDQTDRRHEVMDGFIRHVHDLGMLYSQTHKDAAEKYFSRMAEEDWLARRIRCPQCGHLGMEIRDVLNHVQEDTTGACGELIRTPTAGHAELAKKKVECIWWSHRFTVACPVCGHKLSYEVPLPYLREYRIQLARGEAEFRLPLELQLTKPVKQGSK